MSPSFSFESGAIIHLLFFLSGWPFWPFLQPSIQVISVVPVAFNMYRKNYGGLCFATLLSNFGKVAASIHHVLLLCFGLSRVCGLY